MLMIFILRVDIFVNNGIHFVHLLFHTFNKLELISCAVEIMTFVMNAEIGISVQVIGKKSDTGFKGYDIRDDRESANFSKRVIATAASRG